MKRGALVLLFLGIFIFSILPLIQAFDHLYEYRIELEGDNELTLLRHDADPVFLQLVSRTDSAHVEISITSGDYSDTISFNEWDQLIEEIAEGFPEDFKLQFQSAGAGSGYNGAYLTTNFFPCNRFYDIRDNETSRLVEKEGPDGDGARTRPSTNTEVHVSIKEMSENSVTLLLEKDEQSKEVQLSKNELLSLDSFNFEKDIGISGIYPPNSTTDVGHIEVCLDRRISKRNTLGLDKRILSEGCVSDDQCNSMGHPLPCNEDNTAAYRLMIPLCEYNKCVQYMTPVPCEFSCFEGKCLTAPSETLNETQSATTSSSPEKQGAAMPDSIEYTNETELYPENSYNGCTLDDKQYTFGYRKDGNYCNADELTFTQYKESEESCENNFECKSNLCIDDECISGGLFRRIANWFRRVFGEQ